MACVLSSLQLFGFAFLFVFFGNGIYGNARTLRGYGLLRCSGIALGYGMLGCACLLYFTPPPPSQSRLTFADVRTGAVRSGDKNKVRFECRLLGRR